MAVHQKSEGVVAGGLGQKGWESTSLPMRDITETRMCTGRWGRLQFPGGFINIEGESRIR